jgi:hypothetical protein
MHDNLFFGSLSIHMGIAISLLFSIRDLDNLVKYTCWRGALWPIDVYYLMLNVFTTENDH